MSNLTPGKNQNRNRWMLPARKDAWTEFRSFYSKPEVWSRVGVCLLAAAILWLVTSGWAPAFEWRVRIAPVRDVHAKVEFEYFDSVATYNARAVARTKVLCLYENDPRQLEDLRQELLNELFDIVDNDKSFDDVENESTFIWRSFMPHSPDYSLRPPFNNVVEAVPEGPVLEDSEGTGLDAGDAGPRMANAKLTEVQKVWVAERRERESGFQTLKDALLGQERLEAIQEALTRAFAQIDRDGLLAELEHESGSISEIEVYPKGNADNAHRVSVTDVRISQAKNILKTNLLKEILPIYEDPTVSRTIAERLYNWLETQLPTTLKWDEELSSRVADIAADAVEDVNKTYLPGDALPKLSNLSDNATIRAAEPLNEEDIQLLRAEHRAEVNALDSGDTALRSLFYFGCFGVIFALVSGVLYYRDRHLLDDFRQFSTLVGLMTFTLIVSWALSVDVHWRAEVIPIVIFAMLLTIAYNIELSIILSALVAMAFTATHGFGLAEFLILTAASSTTAMLCRQIRSRTKLVYVGLTVALVIFPTVIGVMYLLGQPLSRSLWMEAIWFAGSCGFAGLFMTALLPFLESWFDIQTDISLLELSDANHPLLKELVQRAPGTYNHSINVASLSEAAAEAIDANGLLCRVGAYFHDIGKIRKPEYFIENQSGHNPHDDLEPSMSKMIITAHVKDGVEIGRRHRLPRRIIDLIEQHHGTTLVEYFFHRAAKKNEEDETTPAVDESEFRYAGPRPQTIEAAVMMLADGVESASRALREPTPARLESLVREIGKKKLDDGQFNECGITLRQLNTVQESLIKSLNAMHHARVSYPEKQTAGSVR